MTDRLWFLPASESWRDDKRVEHTPSFGALGALERSRALEMENAQRLGGPVDALAAQDLQALRSFGAGAAAALEHPSEPEADPENIAFAVAYASATCLREEDLTSAQALPSSWLGVHHSANGWDIFSDAPRGGLNQNALKRHGQLASRALKLVASRAAPYAACDPDDACGSGCGSASPSRKTETERERRNSRHPMERSREKFFPKFQLFT